jgi:hypothetical protein
MPTVSSGYRPRNETLIHHIARIVVSVGKPVLVADVVVDLAVVVAR